MLLAGAEPEELLTAALASAQGRPGLAVGDAIGANVTMLTAALGLAALVRPLPIGPRTRLYALGSALAGVLAVLALLAGSVGSTAHCSSWRTADSSPTSGVASGGTLGRAAGGALVPPYALFVVLVLT